MHPFIEKSKARVVRTRGITGKLETVYSFTEKRDLGYAAKEPARTLVFQEALCLNKLAEYAATEETFRILLRTSDGLRPLRLYSGYRDGRVLWFTQDALLEFVFAGDVKRRLGSSPSNGVYLVSADIDYFTVLASERLEKAACLRR